jgi:hypothetical protein
MKDVDQVKEQLDVRDALPGIPAPAPEVGSRGSWMLASHGLHAALLQSAAGQWD